MRITRLPLPTHPLNALLRSAGQRQQAELSWHLARFGRQAMPLTKNLHKSPWDTLVNHCG